MVKYLLSFLLLFSITLYSQTELKFNLASAPFLVPNIGIEVKISERFGYQLDTSASFYNNIEGSPFHMTQIFNELRFYPRDKKNKRDFFVGAHVGYGMYNLRLPDGLQIFLAVNIKKKVVTNMEEMLIMEKKFH